MVGEEPLVECLEDDLYLLLKQLPVAVLVQQRRTEGLHLPGVAAAIDSEPDAAPGKDVRRGEILRWSPGVPPRLQRWPRPWRWSLWVGLPLAVAQQLLLPVLAPCLEPPAPRCQGLLFRRLWPPRVPSIKGAE